MKRILFVDEQPESLEELRAMMSTASDEWRNMFVDNGRDALASLEEDPFDVIICDIHVPAMDGKSLIGEVMKRYPAVVRIALSDQIEEAASLRSTGSAHQYLAKPCRAGPGPAWPRHSWPGLTEPRRALFMFRLAPA